RYGDWQGVPRDTSAQGRPRSPVTGAPLIPGPRREFIEVFDALDGPPAAPVSGISVGSTTAPAPKRRTALPERGVSGAGPGGDGGDPAGGDGPGGDPSAGQPAKGGKGRTLTGIAAAAVVTVLVVVVAGQVADGGSGNDRASAAEGAGSDAVPGGGGAEPSQRPVKAPVALTYEQLMVRQFPLAADLKGPDTFSAVPGSAAAPPAKGQKFRYRVDIEKGLGLDGELFAQAVQKTLNDDRSWAHNGAMTFERISTGTPDFVITLASPGTTALWCAKSGLDTTEDNVSCDSASTDRVMINAFRWAQGAKTYGAKAMYSYRQMLINHEVGHRLGRNHVNCRTRGALAPVMQQQTKSLDIDGIKCRPNPWVYPTN
ncbi:DUF3152 domain-containing protein, partial [Streptomyces sp. 150FB]|uniref:DUF3152 domain-containing protein n=1 Tax=Streptomyces sp. 150FB TaxID=1576605 RepID=UPI000D146C3E